jgi:serine/threonine protein kinase
VFRAAFRGEPVAAKVVDLGGSSAAQFVREAAALAELRHPAVVGFFGVSLVRGRGVLVMELMEGRDLSRALQLRAPGSQERLYGWYGRGWRCAYDVAKALNFLHSKARGLPMRLKGGPPCALQSSAAGGSEV